MKHWRLDGYGGRTRIREAEVALGVGSEESDDDEGWNGSLGPDSSPCAMFELGAFDVSIAVALLMPFTLPVCAP